MNSTFVALVADGIGTGSRRRNCCTGDQLRPLPMMSLARTRQYSAVSAGYVDELVYAVEVVMTSSIVLENVGSDDTCRRYSSAPSVEVHENVGWDTMSALGPGFVGVGGVEFLSNGWLPVGIALLPDPSGFSGGTTYQ